MVESSSDLLEPEYPSLEGAHTVEAICAFLADYCPACDVQKPRLTDPLCGECFGSLSSEVQERLCDPGLFLEAFHLAMKYLKTL